MDTINPLFHVCYGTCFEILFWKIILPAPQMLAFLPGSSHNINIKKHCIKNPNTKDKNEPNITYIID